MNEYDKIAIIGIVVIASLWLLFSVGVFLGLLGMTNDLASQVRECKGTYVSTNNK